MRALSLLLLIIYFSLNFSSIYSQSTPQPTPPSGGSNSTYYDTVNNAYIFKYDNDSEKLRYTYSLHADSGLACLKALRVRVNSSYNFWPSYGGGIAWLYGSDTLWSWETSASHTLLGHSISNNIVTLQWKTAYNLVRDPYIFYYRYIIEIGGRTLIIKVVQDSSNAGNTAVHFNLDRCEDVINPVIIGVPYLTMFNLLYCDNSTSENKVFTSMFFDWDSTGCSRLETQNLDFSSTSKRYSQFAVYNPKTNNVRNSLHEKIYLTVSPELEETLPNIPNPVSPMRDSSVQRFVWDQWGNTQQGFNRLKLLDKCNIDNLWINHHVWQHYGYDVKYPDTYPANTCTEEGYGTYIDSLSKLASNRGDLFALHENYIDYHPDAPSYNVQHTTKKPDGDYVISYIFNGGRTEFNDCKMTPLNGEFSTYVLKSTLYNNYYYISEDIHDTYNTNASYLDVHSSYDPSIYVDYSYNQTGAGRFTEVLSNNHQIGDDMRGIHNGPVSGEGLAHFLYAGYYDDFEAQIHTGQSLPGMHYLHTNSDEQFGGYYKPLLVHFGLNKIRPKTFSHGVGYSERFFYNTEYWKYTGRSLDSMLRLQATVLAYGHGAWMNSLGSNEWDDTTYAKIVRDHIYVMQELYGNAQVSSITYNDNGTMKSVSQYIKDHPSTFNCFDIDADCGVEDFMGQIKIVYNNGTIVYVNRHPTESWNGISGTGIWYNCHASINSGSVVLDTGTVSGQSFSLPPENGWVCFANSYPSSSYNIVKRNEITLFKFRLSQNYPNPFNPVTEINYEIANEVSVTIKVYNILGQLVTTLVNNELKKPGVYKSIFDGKNFASGVYFYRIEAGNFIDWKKMVLIK